MSSAARWSIVVAIAVLGMAAVLWSTLSAPSPSPGVSPADDASSAQARAAGGLSPGPYLPADAAARESVTLPQCAGPETSAAAGADGTVPAQQVVCMSDGSTRTLGDIQRGRPMLLNMWAYWCEPCRRELPALQTAAAALDGEVTVALAHIDPQEAKGLTMLQELGITTLPAVQDPAEAIPGLVQAPPVLPVSVFINADGTVAQVLPQTLESPQMVYDAVTKYLGVEVPQ